MAATAARTARAGNTSLKPWPASLRQSELLDLNCRVQCNPNKPKQDCTGKFKPLSSAQSPTFATVGRSQRWASKAGKTPIQCVFDHGDLKWDRLESGLGSRYLS